MARDVADDTYYKVTGGKIPVKWTAPEVSHINTSISSSYSYVTAKLQRWIPN